MEIANVWPDLLLLLLKCYSEIRNSFIKDPAHLPVLPYNPDAVTDEFQSGAE